ncbi:hypothetical protein QV65_32130 [Rhodococcus erythropolis]|nr:hypothetical protein QV65_32130 [Rhodococcus erythropolis]
MEVFAVEGAPVVVADPGVFSVVVVVVSVDAVVDPAVVAGSVAVAVAVMVVSADPAMYTYPPGEGQGTRNPYGGADRCKFGQPLPHHRAIRVGGGVAAAGHSADVADVDASSFSVDVDVEACAGSG